MEAFKMTLAGQWLEEGIQKGRKEGIQKGREDIARVMKGMKHITRKDIVKATGLTDEEIEKL